MLLEVLTPQKLLYRGKVDHVKMPGIDGSFGVMNNHAPLISALQKGRVYIEQSVSGNKQFDELSGEFITDIAKDTQFDFAINGGVVEVLKNKIIILAE
jgi:F-type H+-transporting ATPase subunit epsilon